GLPHAGWLAGNRRPVPTATPWPACRRGLSAVELCPDPGGARTAAPGLGTAAPALQQPAVSGHRDDARCRLHPPGPGALPAAGPRHAEPPPAIILPAHALGTGGTRTLPSARHHLVDAAAVTAGGPGKHPPGRRRHTAGMLADRAGGTAAAPAPPLVSAAARLAGDRRRTAARRPVIGP